MPINPQSSGSTRRRHRVLRVVATGVALVIAGGCANDATITAGSGGGGGSTTLGDGGWIGGAPPSDDAGGDGYGYGDTDEKAMASESYDAASAPRSSAAERSSDSGAGVEGSVAPPDSSPLRAGNIDDNADYDAFLAYLDRIAGSSVPYRALDVRGRIVVKVTDDAGKPVAGASVVVNSGQEEVVELRTTADGTTRFHPGAYGSTATSFRISVGDASVDATPGTSVTITAGAAPVVERVPLDIAFAIDTTGSMGDELERLTSSIGSVVDRIEALPGRPDIRLAMTVFRDDGDAYVTATHDFTSDIAAFREALDEITAGGGGDVPEALDEAVDEILAKPAWRPAGEATQLVFIVGDAGGHPERKVARPYTESAKDAASRGIKLIPIAASSTDDQAEVAFRQMAQFTGARFVFLAYGAGGAAVGGSSDVTPTDYEELSLDDLIVRLVADELAARTGTEVAVPTTVTTTTRPNGQ